MIVIGADGLEGEMHTPMAMPMRLFSQGMVVQRGIAGQLTQAITFVENGDMQFSAEAIASPKTSNIIGTFTAPIAYCYKPDDYKQSRDNQLSVEERVSDVLDLINELYFSKFRASNGFDASGENAKIIDVMIETVPRVGRDEFLIYIDRKDVVIEMDMRFKALQDDVLQDKITSHLMGIKAIPEPKLIGYGLLHGKGSDAWSKMTRPNTYIRVAPRTVLKVGRTSNDFLKTEWQVQTFYMHILAEALKRWIGDVIPAYTLNDWVAFANLLVGAFAGYGNTDRTQNWLATDIETSVNMMPGFGWTKANRFLWGNVKTEEDFKYYFCVMNLLGFAVQRTKAAMDDFVVKTVVSTNDWQVPMRFKRAMEPNIGGWGSTGTFLFLMPRNNFAYGEKTDIPFPCIVDDRRIDEQTDIIKYANNYEDLLPYKQQTWKDVTIDRGEVPQGAINNMSMDAQFMRLHATTDARIIEYQDTRTEYIRRLMQYRFPIDHLVMNGLGREDRMRLFLWGIFANGEKGMKNAYVIESSLGVFKPQIVNYRRGPLDTQLVDKSGTQTKGDQIIKPGTLPSTVGSTGNTRVEQDIKPTAPMKKAPFSEKTIELKSGEEVAEYKAVDAGNTNANETNNQPEEK